MLSQKKEENLRRIRTFYVPLATKTTATHKMSYLHVFNLLKRTGLEIRDLFLPRLCPVCGKRLMMSESFICLTCVMHWPRYEIERTDDNRMLRQLWPSVPVSHGASLIVYRPDSDFHEVLMDIKYRGRPDLAHEMGRWAAMELMGSRLVAAVDTLVPVPLSKKKKRKRGYNQAEKLAEGLSEVLKLPVNNWLTREEGTGSMTQLNYEERLKATEGLYKAHIPESHRGKRILIIDDVMTTGSTLAACTKAILEEDQTAEISIFTLAYTV
jgi:ComF family protein